MPKLRALVHASQLFTGAGIRRKDGRKIQEADLGLIEDGALVYSVKKVGSKEIPHRVEWVGATSGLPKKYSRVSKKDLKKQKVVTAGFVDCHTHLVFAGDRSEEFALRSAGATYEEIAKKGGGIATTVRATREATSAQLEKLAEVRLKEAYAWGIRTVEIKSGYGLSTESEIKILEVVQKLIKKHPEMTIVPTFLGAHAYPKDQSREAYLNDLLERMLPEVARRKLATSCDVFIDDGYYTRDEGKRILTKAKELGLAVRVHADEMGDTDSAALAAELGALSADHLLKVSEKGIQKLAQSQTVSVLLPGTAFYLKAAHAPARKLIQSGACVALSTDFNPGTCMTQSLPAIMTLGALYLGMSRAEILAAVTYNAAKALGLSGSKGSLEPGKDADFTILNAQRFEEIYYRFAWQPS
ncbi:imidazolonepropionase [bacterium]|nr:imidazolonepropionase [bacterium]